MGTHVDPPTGFLHIPQLIAALCYHLALQDCENIDIHNVLSRAKSRDGLYRAYRDIAFSQLFGLNQPHEQRLQSSWTSLPDSSSLKEEEEVFQADRPVGNVRLAMLKERLVEGHVHGPHGVDYQDEGNESQRRRCDLLVPDGFKGAQISQKGSFTLSEGPNCYKFLEHLKDSAVSEHMDPSDLENYDNAFQRDYRELNRGLFVNEIPDSIHNPLSDDFGDSQRCHKPVPQGWFLEDTRGCVDTSTTFLEPSPRKVEPMVYQTSRSPVKVSLGSLFLDQSPGKMTFFEDTHSVMCAQDETRMDASRNMQRQPDAISYNQEVISACQTFGTYSVPLKNLWSGEECEIAREALLALSGIKASLSKLRGRLISPQALPRPAIAPILLDMEKAASSRASLESYIHTLLHETPTDPVSYALASSLKEILYTIDKTLVALEINESENWVQPIGIADKTRNIHAGNVLNSIHRPGGQTLDFKSYSYGAEYHGAGVSILSLAHATTESQSMLLFLSSFLDLETLRHKNVSEYPKGRILLESLYSKSSLLEGNQGRVAKKLFLGALSPYASVVSDWAFGIESLSEDHCFVGLLSKDYSMRLPARAKDISGRWISGLGPSDIPSFFSEESKKSLLIAGTQLRLLYSISHPQLGDGDSLWSPRVRGGPRNNEEYDEPWFMHPDYSTILRSGSDSDNDNMCIKGCNGEAPVLLASKQQIVNSCPRSITSCNWGYTEPKVVSDGSLSGNIPLSFHLDILMGSILKRQASVVSQACLNLFINDLNAFGLIQYMRNIFMGFTGDFQSEFLRILEPSMSSLEPLTLHKVRSAMIMASSNSCLSDSKYTENLVVNLLPAENAISLVDEAFRGKSQFSDVSRIKSPFHTAMRPILVPPTGCNAFDCINVSFDPSWPTAALLSEDTLTAYSAILSMRLRVNRAKYALDTMRTLCFGRNVMKQLLSFELVPWIQNLKSLCSFCFRAASHLSAILQFYESNCGGEYWAVLQSTLNCPVDGRLSIHDLIQTHRKYVYESSGRILTCCNNPKIENTIQGMIELILELKGTLEAKIREAEDIRLMLADTCSWQDIERKIIQYDRLIETMKDTHSTYNQAITEGERSMKTFLQCFLSD